MPQEEIWLPIPEFPMYHISNLGQVFNTRTERLMALSTTQQGDRKVVMTSGGRRVTRAIRVLVAEAFVDSPFPESDFQFAQCDTVIMLDGNKEHIYPENLAWRPRWFAHKYAAQLHKQQPDHFYDTKVINNETGVIYGSIIEAGVSEGLLFRELYNSIVTGSTIYPSFSTYSWVDV